MGKQMRLNEGPLQKEEQSLPLSGSRSARAHASMKGPSRRRGNPRPGSNPSARSSCLNEGPLQKEGQ